MEDNKKAKYVLHISKNSLLVDVEKCGSGGN